jgi:hypothetical protein
LCVVHPASEKGHSAPAPDFSHPFRKTKSCFILAILTGKEGKKLIVFFWGGGGSFFNKPLKSA